jgi:pimeloyl-ACP methyl ester carboxylesterase
MRNGSWKLISFASYDDKYIIDLAAQTTPKMSNSNEPFSFREILNAEGPPPPSPEMVVASDGVELAIRVYKPPPQPQPKKNNPPNKKAVLVFYHGGGAHSGAGYQSLGWGLSSEYGVTVYTPDLRGHGASGGPRGDAPSAEQVWRDINTVLEHVRNKEGDKNVPLFLGGHSSGGGLIVNYSSWSERLLVDGYILVSPQLGYLSGTARPSSSTKSEFAKVNILAFLANGFLGVLGHNKAVQFRYPPEILSKDPGMVGWNTVNMANAITPSSPQEQCKSIMMDDMPIGLWVGSEDEMFVAENVAEFGRQEQHKESCSVVVSGQNHLGILVQAHQFLGPWIIEHAK